MRATDVQGMHSLTSYQRTPHKPHLEECIPLHAERPHAYTMPGVDARPADHTTPLPLPAVGDTAVARDGEGGARIFRGRSRRAQSPRGATRLPPRSRRRAKRPPRSPTRRLAPARPPPTTRLPHGRGR